MIFRILLRKKYSNHVFLGSYFNAYCDISISVTEILTILHTWACCNQIQQFFSFIILYNVTFNNMADDVPSEPCSNQTVVSLLDHFRPPAPNGLSRTLSVLKCSTPVFLEVEGYYK